MQGCKHNIYEKQVRKSYNMFRITIYVQLSQPQANKNML